MYSIQSLYTENNETNNVKTQCIQDKDLNKYFKNTKLPNINSYLFTSVFQLFTNIFDLKSFRHSDKYISNLNNYIHTKKYAVIHIHSKYTKEIHYIEQNITVLEEQYEYDNKFTIFIPLYISLKPNVIQKWVNYFMVCYNLNIHNNKPIYKNYDIQINNIIIKERTISNCIDANIYDLF